MKALSRTSPLIKRMNLAHAWHVPHPLMQRKCPCGGIAGPTGECAECRKRRLARENQNRNSRPERTDSHVPPIVNEVLHSSGQPLDPSTRAFMEPRFGHDFSHVRIHTNSGASESARAVNALAYTVGQDVVFAAGQYVPETTAGKKLLAHELAHTIQQNGLASQQTGDLTVTPPTHASEREADNAAQYVLKAGSPGSNANRPRIRPVSTPMISRQNPPVEQMRCRAIGVPCPQQYFEITKGYCDLIGCRAAVTREKTTGLISPGTCRFRCPDYSICSGPVVGTKWFGWVPFTLCDVPKGDFPFPGTSESGSRVA
jgi:hypothetical protein